MASIILDLQRDALDKNVRVSDLLRKALVVARKLRLSEFQDWIERELNGYSKDVPDYRKVRGDIKAWNPYHGWQPVHFDNAKLAKSLSTRSSGQSIGEIEDLVGGAEPSSEFHMPFPPETDKQLRESIDFNTQISLFIGRSSLVKTLEVVRNIVLNWALKLEEDGILGEGLSFSSTEHAAAEKSPQNVNYFFGTVHGAQIAQGIGGVTIAAHEISIDAAALASLATRIRSKLPELGLDPAKESELKSELSTLEAQAASPKPKKGIVKETLSSIRSILEGAGGTAVGQLVIEISKIAGGALVG